MKNKDVLKILNALLFLCVLLLIVLLIPLIFAKFNNPDISTLSDIEDLCSNLSLQEAGSCAVNLTSGFYKYNPENVGKELSFSELKEQGGVCSNWSEYYTEIGKNLGYNARNVIIPLSDDIYHEFSVWSGEDGYCVIDQTNINCTGLE